MRLSLNWLSDHVDLAGLRPDEIASRLTMRTALIEGFQDQRPGVAGVVVGEVLECGKHPGADRLSLCRVEFGGGRTAQVVCGAPNVRAGQKVLFAPVGTLLPNGVKLKAAKIRGQSSEGMICAEDELALGPEHDGILVLDGGTPTGAPAAELPGLFDVVFEIDNKSITHRPDLWSHRGFARELAAIFGRSLLELQIDERLKAGDSGPSIELRADAGCDIYAGLCVEDAVSRSPDWLRFRLLACGVRSLNLLVDLSNYVMLELGQPTHPFDRDRLAGGGVTVRMAGAGEELRTLDGVDRILGPEDMVIADAEGVVALAGIMGCERAEVGPSTQRVFLESAHFDPVLVRRTSSRLGLRTDASARFEKSLDPALAMQAVRRFARLLGTLRPSATVASAVRVAGGNDSRPLTIKLPGALVRDRLGLAVGDDEISSSLQSLGFDVERGAEATLMVAVPSWRATRDVSRAEDLVEEVGRILGYDRIPTREPVGRLRVATRAPLLAMEDALRDSLVTRGAFTEVESYSFVADALLERVGFADARDQPLIANPLQQDSSRLRPSVVPALLARLEDWLRALPSARFFEVGRAYRMQSGVVVETRELGALVASREMEDARDLVRRLRGLVELALAGMDRAQLEFQAWQPGPREPWFHPRRSAAIKTGGSTIGRLGAVHPVVMAALGLPGSAGLLVLDTEALTAAPTHRPLLVAPARFPPSLIDLALVAGYDVSVESLAIAIRKAGPPTLLSVQAFDVYREGLRAGERSIAFHLVFQSPQRTLTDDDIAAARADILKALEGLGARLR